MFQVACRLTFAPRFWLLVFGSVGLIGVAVPGSHCHALAWMEEGAIRGDIIGHTLEGHYGNGVTWTESYTQDGRLDYREGARGATGAWSFRGPAFCTFYDPAFRGVFNGGCWQVLKTSANCYEFFQARQDRGNGGGRSRGDDDESDGDEGPASRPIAWNARGWRRGEPSTCEEKPTV